MNSISAEVTNNIDIALSNIELVIFDFDGVFTDNTVSVSQDGVESVRCWRSDGLGISKLRRIGVLTYIVSTEVNPVVMARAEKLKIPCKQGVEDKAATVLDTCRELEVNPKCVSFVGNDINDIPAFKVIGLPIAVADAYSDVEPYIMFRTSKPGGLGAVREVCDLVCNAKDKR